MQTTIAIIVLTVVFIIYYLITNCIIAKADKRKEEAQYTEGYNWAYDKLMKTKSASDINAVIHGMRGLGYSHNHHYAEGADKAISDFCLIRSVHIFKTIERKSSQ